MCGYKEEISNLDKGDIHAEIFNWTFVFVPVDTDEHVSNLFLNSCFGYFDW